MNKLNEMMTGERVSKFRLVFPSIELLVDVLRGACELPENLAVFQVGFAEYTFRKRREEGNVRESLKWFTELSPDEIADFFVEVDAEYVKITSAPVPQLVNEPEFFGATITITPR